MNFKNPMIYPYQILAVSYVERPKPVSIVTPYHYVGYIGRFSFHPSLYFSLSVSLSLSVALQSTKETTQFFFFEGIHFQ